MGIVLKGENLVKDYGKKHVVKNVSFEVEQGQIIGLLGPNGAGKTTSFYMIVGLVKATTGKVSLDKLDITNDAMYKRAQKGIGYLAQEASVFRKLSVEDNIKSVLQFTKLSKAQQQRKTDELIEEFSLEHVRKNRGDLLSGGERRRTEIARCLATEPKFILLDEPFAGVDPIAVEDIQKIVRSLKHKNIGILITDHNVSQTLAITDKTYIMFEGKILKEGTPEELANDKDVRRVYLGENFIFQNISDESSGNSQQNWKGFYVYGGNFTSEFQFENEVKNVFDSKKNLQLIYGSENLESIKNLDIEIAELFGDSRIINAGGFNSFVIEKINLQNFKSAEDALKENIDSPGDKFQYLGSYIFETP